MLWRKQIGWWDEACLMASLKGGILSMNWNKKESVGQRPGGEECLEWKKKKRQGSERKRAWCVWGREVEWRQGNKERKKRGCSQVSTWNSFKSATTAQLYSAEVSVETSWSCSFTPEPLLDIRALP